MRAKVATMDLDHLHASAENACKLLRVLGNPNRLLLLCQMSQGEFCVGDLEGLTGIQQPTLSQQLTVLRDEGMVETRRDGKLIFYNIASKEAVAVMQVLYEQFCSTRRKQKK